jgi:hypothetical protein
MWLRVGRWVEFGVHFGTRNMRLEMPNRYLVHASVRFGKSEWYHGPDRPEMTEELNAHHNRTLCPPVDRYPDPEPLRWGTRKTTMSTSHSQVDTMLSLSGKTSRRVG